MGRGYEGGGGFHPGGLAGLDDETELEAVDVVVEDAETRLRGEGREVGRGGGVEEVAEEGGEDAVSIGLPRR